MTHIGLEPKSSHTKSTLSHLS